jgi:hypothetical protein
MTEGEITRTGGSLQPVGGFGAGDDVGANRARRVDHVGRAKTVEISLLDRPSRDVGPATPNAIAG